MTMLGAIAAGGFLVGVRNRWGERQVRCGAVAAAALVMAGLALANEHYAINWSSVDGGGGTSTGGVYTVSGTIGQPDASAVTMTGGNYALTGGFWTIIAIQKPGGPTLTIAPAGPGMATLSWAPDTPGFVLQETLALTPENWSNSPSGAANPVTVTVPNDTTFYRLDHP